MCVTKYVTKVLVETAQDLVLGNVHVGRQISPFPVRKTFLLVVTPVENNCHVAITPVPKGVNGSCGQCIEVAVKKGRCGQKQKQIACTKEFTCEKKCSSLRDCGVHKCNLKCCEGNCPSCEQICGKSLKCRNHKCGSRCHKGPCYPCPLTVDIRCHCQKTKVTVLCGKERDARPPRCNFPCLAPTECHHPSRQKHRCHFEGCPPCNFVCGLKLKGCKHTCPVVCHDAICMKIEDKSAKAGPWDIKPVRVDKVKKPCPTCRVPLPIQCVGLHETSEVPCSQLKPYSCGRKCGRLLSCGNHKCERECDTVTGAIDSVNMPCGHACGASCHAGPCPNVDNCNKKITLKCRCKRIKKEITCKEKADSVKPKCDETCQAN